MKHAWTLFPALFVVCLFRSALGQNVPNPVEVSFTVSGSQTWTDTGLDLAAGDTLALSVEPKAGTDSSCKPEGAASSTADSTRLPLSSAPGGAVIAKTAENAVPSVVATGSTLKAEAAGHLYLGINEVEKSKCTFAVKVSITHAGAASAAAPENMKQKLSSAAQVWLKGQFGGSASGNAQSSNAVTGNAASAGPAAISSSLSVPTVALDSDLRGHLDSLPRRVDDHAGHLGDMVNFVIVGSEDGVKAVLDTADWHVADVDNKEAGLKAVMQTYQKKDYLQMPMSHLYLWNRMQDYGYEQAQAFSVVASRHHFRLWKAPFTWNNETVWVGAATHDIGFEKDIRTGKITHKIDPNVDDERSNLAQSLEKSGKVKSMTFYLPPDPIQEAKNASGGSYHSDGRLLVVFLK